MMMDSSVPEFYKGKSIFITGGSGFVGKVLIYKILKSCPDVKIIYVLMRQKKDISSEERLKELFASRAFNILRELRPDYFKKLQVIPGDITEDGLGLTGGDRNMLQNECNVVIHSAACVRFDQKLKDAVNMNVKGTLRVLTLAESMKKLEVFVHLSTAYCRCELETLHEQLYPAVHSPRKIMDLVDWMDDETLDYVEPKLISSEPNTYSYTKAITENLVAEYSEKFPTAIARLSIIIGSMKEPVPGWVDNKQGPTGLIIGSSKGVIRSMHCESSHTIDALPVDVIVNACLLIAYVTAIDRPKETQVYNITVSDDFKITWEDVIRIGEKLNDMYPFTIALWYHGGTLKSYWIHHQISSFLFHTIPAYLVDGLLFLLRKKTFLVRTQKRIANGLKLLHFYAIKQWNFTNNNFKALRNRISKADDQEFYTDVTVIKTREDLFEYFANYLKGIREFVCKEDPSNLPRARKLHRIRYVADLTVKIIFYVLLAWFFYSYFYFFTYSLEYLDRSMKKLLPS